MESVLVKGELDLLSDLDGGGDVIEVGKELDDLGVDWILRVKAVGDLSSTEAVVLEEGDAVLFVPGIVSVFVDLEVGKVIISFGLHLDPSWFAIWTHWEFLTFSPSVVSFVMDVSLAFG